MKGCDFTEVQTYTRFNTYTRESWLAFLRAAELQPSDDADFTVIVYEDDEIAAVGSRSGCILKYIAVSPDFQGMGLTATILTELRKNAFSAGIRHLFLYTKPKNRQYFEDFLFYPVEATSDVLLMENRRRGLDDFVASLPPLPEHNGSRVPVTGSVVMNCNPFTRGHRYLIETAAALCDRLCVFVLSEDRSEFSAADRLEMVRAGTADLQNVFVFQTGDYLISSATFPDYFLRERSAASAVQCELDCRIFGAHFAPRFGISRRFAGTEPLSPVTETYNRAMEKLLPEYGIEFTEIPRLCLDDGSPVSASAVRAALGARDSEALLRLVPQSTFDHIVKKGLI